MVNPSKIQESTLPQRQLAHQQVSKMAFALSIGIALIYLAFLKPGIWGFDGNDLLDVSQSSVLLTALTTSLVAWLALRLGSSCTGVYLAASCFALGTTALVYAREFFAEPLLSFITASSLYFALGKTSCEYLGASRLSGLALTAKPAGIVIEPV